MLLSRREILEKCLALGAVTTISAFAPSTLLEAWAQQELRARRATPGNALGPFYKKGAPLSRGLQIPGDPGLPLAVSGQVFSVRGESLPNASIDVWHTDHLGRYDLDGYRYRARFAPDAAGKYSFDSVMPGHYPDRVCQHIHYLVKAPGHKPLITQLYFATDPVFEGDPDRNYTRDPLIGNRELVRPVMLAGDPQAIQAKVQFELVLERL